MICTSNKDNLDTTTNTQTLRIKQTSLSRKVENQSHRHGDDRREGKSRCRQELSPSNGRPHAGQARSLHHVDIYPGHTQGSGVKTKSHEPASALRAALDRDASSKHK